MRDPASLEVLTRANELTRLTYEATRRFPASERDGLRDQMQRCVTSVRGNIAEGCGRSTDRAFLSYLQNATASVTELAQHAESAKVIGIGVRAELEEVQAMAGRVRRMLAKLQTAVRVRGRA
jgi:four helix bundle protein